MGLPSELAEVWSWYAIGVAIFFTRWAARIRTVGFKGLAGDDYVSVFTLLFYTLDAATVHIVYYSGQNVIVTEADIPNLTEHDIARLTYGSKIELTAWYSYVSLLWCLKFTMLFFYKRITTGTVYHKRIVNALFYFIGVAYIIDFIVLSTGCYPIQKNWQVVPIAPWKCSFRPQNCLATVILNVISDAALLSVPIPLLWKLKIPLKKKIVIGVIMSSGLFVITAAIIRAVLSLDTTPSAANINRWGVRETIIGIIAVNVPALRPLATRAFWTWGPYDPTAGSSHRSEPRSYGNTHQSRTATTWRGKPVEGDDIEMGRSEKSSGRESQEVIIPKGGNGADKSKGFVTVETTYDITRHDRNEVGSLDLRTRNYTSEIV